MSTMLDTTARLIVETWLMRTRLQVPNAYRYDLIDTISRTLDDVRTMECKRQRAVIESAMRMCREKRLNEAMRVLQIILDSEPGE